MRARKSVGPYFFRYGRRMCGLKIVSVRLSHFVICVQLSREIVADPIAVVSLIPTGSTIIDPITVW